MIRTATLSLAVPPPLAIRLALALPLALAVRSFLAVPPPLAVPPFLAVPPPLAVRLALAVPPFLAVPLALAVLLALPAPGPAQTVSQTAAPASAQARDQASAQALDQGMGPARTPAPSSAGPSPAGPSRVAAGTPADPLPAEGLTIEQFLWTGRPLIVFAESPSDPAFQRQMQLLAQNPADLLDRQVVIITDTDAVHLSDLRRRLRPNGFAIALIDTNGRPLLTRPTPRPVREIAATIDKSPQRRQELQDRRSGG